MTLRSRKKPPTTVLKPAILNRSTSKPNSSSLSNTTAFAAALGLWIAFCPSTFAQTKKPSWSAKRPVTQNQQPKRSLSSTAVRQDSRTSSRETVSRRETKPTSRISATLLTPSNANRTVSVSTPRLTARPPASPSPKPNKSLVPIADTLKSQPRIQQRSKLRPAERPQAPSIASSETRLRETEMPNLVATPKPPKTTKPAISLPSVRQPGSIQLVQFEEDAPISDGLDFDSAFPEFSNEAPATKAPAPSPDDIFGKPKAKSVDPIDMLFKDDTPAPTVPESPNETSSQTSQSAQPQMEFSTQTPFAPAELPAPNPTTSLSPSAESIPSVPDSESLLSVEPKPQQTGNPFSQTGDELRKEIEDSLEALPDLPRIDGSQDDGTLPEPDLTNPLKDPDDELNDPPAPPTNAGDLSTTNGRDCQASGKACSDELAYLRRRELTDMSLDITPSIEPREFDMTKVEQVRVEKLSNSPAKTWTDRSGQIIAEGTFEDYRNGKVIVRTVNGSMQAIPDYRLSNTDRCFVNAWWELPDECHFEDEQFTMRDFRMTTFTWTAAATCHKPLYFEEVSVERYGHSAGPIVQPIRSGVHFFGNIVMLPYHMGITPTNECVYPLGYYRPGDCAPWIVPGFPMSHRGFKWQSMAVGMGIWLLP